MKKIVLLGDSIRMGYDKYVKEALADLAEVYYPEKENCRNTAYALRYLHEWKEAGKWPDDVDLVHWNIGLWDVLELFGDEPLTSISEYERNIAKLNARLHMLFPRAKMVFATSTSVHEERYPQNFKRHNAIIAAYNEAARRALRDTDTTINDLYALTLSFPDEYRSDMTHYYTDEGTARIGGRVLSIVCKLLDIPTTAIHLENFTPDALTDDTVGY